MNQYKSVKGLNAISRASLAFLPLMLLLTLTSTPLTSLKTSRAYNPATPPITPTPTPTLPTTPPITVTPTVTPAPKYRINWQTANVSLQAEDFYIQVAGVGKNFTARNARLNLHSDPGDPKYTTLEATWQEQGKEMRLYIYFRNDGNYWWANEIRTYDGQKKGNWIYYRGEFFKTKMNFPFTGTIKIYSDSAQSSNSGVIYFKNLRLSTTFR